LTAQIAREDQKLSVGMHAIGMRLLEIRKRELWKASHSSYTSYIEDEAQLSTRKAYACTRLAESFSAAVAARYVPRKLDALIRYRKGLNTNLSTRDFLNAKVYVGTRKSERVVTTLHRATASQIERVLKERGVAPGVPAMPRDTKRRLNALERALPRPVPGMKQHDRVTAKVAKDGTVAVSIRDVAAGDMAELGALLRKHFG